MIQPTLRGSFHSRLSQCGQTAVPAVAAQRPWWLPAAVLAVLAAVFSPGLVHAGVAVRVESRPAPVPPLSSSPIKVNVTVTDGMGQPVGGLTLSDFAVTVGGLPIALVSGDFSLPPADPNSNRNVSVVFAVDYSPSTASVRTVMQDAVVTFINSMTPGDYAAIVKFNGTAGATLIQPFTMIDGMNGTSMLVGAAMTPYAGSSTNVFDAIVKALDQFSSPPVPLPEGPKAVVVISDGADNTSAATLNSAIGAASSGGIPVFSIALSNASTSGRNVLSALAARTGGSYISTTDAAAITTAYGTIASRLNNSYLLTFQSSIVDCTKHTVVVQVRGQTASGTADFTRCDLAETPPSSPPSTGGGGGGAFGVMELLAGLFSLVGVVARRRRLALCSQMA